MSDWMKLTNTYHAKTNNTSKPRKHVINKMWHVYGCTYDFCFSFYQIIFLFLFLPRSAKNYLHQGGYILPSICCWSKFHKMKILASMLVSCICLSHCLFIPHWSPFNSNLHQTLHRGRHQSKKNWLNLGNYLYVEPDQHCETGLF